VLIDGIRIDFASIAEDGRGELLHFAGIYHLSVLVENTITETDGSVLR
jgi:hypothetical protein